MPVVSKFVTTVCWLFINLLIIFNKYFGILNAGLLLTLTQSVGVVTKLL